MKLLILIALCTVGFKCEQPYCNTDPYSSYVAPDGHEICLVKIKAGTYTFTFDQNSCNDQGYCADGIGTWLGRAERNCEEGRYCPAISWVEYWISPSGQTATPEPITLTATPEQELATPTPVSTWEPATPTLEPEISTPPPAVYDPVTPEPAYYAMPTPTAVPVTGGGSWVGISTAAVLSAVLLSALTVLRRK